MKFKKEKIDTITPTKGHKTDAGYDIYSPISFIVEAHSFSDRINLEVGFEIPEGYVGYVVERSSQGKAGINVIGPVVDYGYTGNIHCTLVNNSDIPYEVYRGERICQLLLLKIGMEELEEVESFNETERGENAHGSTGR